MEVSTARLKDLLVRPGFITEDNFVLAEKLAKEKDSFVVDVLIDKNFIKDEQLGQVIARALGFPFINLRKEKIDEKVLAIVPEIVARSRGVIAFARDDLQISVGMLDPTDLEMIHILEKRFGRAVKFFYITERDFQSALSQYRGSLKEEAEQIFANWQKSERPQKEKDKDIVRIVDLLIENAYINKASDIHIEPYINKVVVRYRIDGVMHTVLDLDKKFLEPVISRIKIVSKLRIDEHRSSQDGKIKYKTQGKNIDIRVSIVPVMGGENIVMRLLSSKNRAMGIDSLGMSDFDMAKIQGAIRNPQGMILVTGPTGCGKTTTVYEVLKLLNTDEVHIASIEDPIEYDIEGVSQIQVNTKANMTFANGLRAIVRQDPDIIMVGEIRDTETVDIAINSAMTGHLVLSTLHTNDAGTTMPRLIDMGIEPYLIATTVNVVIAQRLVRALCPKCRYSYKLSAKEIAAINKKQAVVDVFSALGRDVSKLTLYKGKGCKSCNESGFSGRIGVFEVMEMNDNIKDKILSKSSSAEIQKVSVEGGMTTILTDGINKAINGITTIDEVLRVTTGTISIK